MCDLEDIGDPFIFKLTRRTTTLSRMCPTFDLCSDDNTLFGYVNPLGIHFISYERQIKRELKGIHICGCRCNVRLKTKTDGSTRLTYTGLCGELEQLKIETRLIGESFECVMGDRVI